MNIQTETEIRNILENAHPAHYPYAVDLAESLLGDDPSEELVTEFKALVAEYAPAVQETTFDVAGNSLFGDSEPMTITEARDYLEFARSEWQMTDWQFTVEERDGKMRVSAECVGGFIAHAFNNWRESSQPLTWYCDFPRAE